MFLRTMAMGPAVVTPHFISLCFEPVNRLLLLIRQRTDEEAVFIEISTPSCLAVNMDRHCGKIQEKSRSNLRTAPAKTETRCVFISSPPLYGIEENLFSPPALQQSAPGFSVHHPTTGHVHVNPTIIIFFWWSGNDHVVQFGCCRACRTSFCRPASS